jgi:hypothetical protein
MMAVLLLAWLGLFVIRGPSGQPLLSLEDIGLTPGFLDQWTEKPEVPVGLPTVKRVYTWKDDQGVTQFSDHEEDAVGATVLELDGIINILPALQMQDAETALPAPGVAAESTVIPGQLGDAMQTMEQARQLQQVLDARKDEIDQLIRPGN